MSRRARILPALLGLIVLLGSGLSLPAAASAQGWVDQGPVSPAAAVATSPEIAITVQGTRVVAWIAKTVTPTPTETVSVRVAPAGGAFGALQTFSGNGFDLRLATGADGTAALAWFDDSKQIRVARLAPGATRFTEPTPAPFPAGESPLDIRVAVTSSGEVFTAFTGFGQDGTGIWVHSLAAGSSALELTPGAATGGAVDRGTFDTHGIGSSVSGADIAASGEDVYVTWQQDAVTAAPPTPQAVTVRRSQRVGAPASRFTVPANVETIQQTGFFSTETLLASGGSHVYVTWLRPSVQGRGVVGYTDLTRPDTVHVISTDPGPDIAFAAADGTGTLIVTGGADPSGTDARLVYAATVPPGAASARAVDLTPPGPAREAEALAVAADGTAVILPDRIPDLEGQIVQIEASRRLPGGDFGAPEDVSGVQDGGGGDGGNAAVAIAPDGSEFAAWLATDADGSVNDRIHLSERDATPPQFAATTIPSVVAVGASARLTASAVDALTGPASIQWDFGDGSQATGNGVTHVFGTPGPRTITVTATDTVGNSAVQTRTVVVRATPTPAPRLSHVVFRPSRFRAARGSTASVAAKPSVHGVRAPRGSALSLTLNVRATVVVDVRHGRHRISELVRLSLPAGPARLAFTGRFGGQALSPGRYAATVTAIDAARRRSHPVSASFTIVRG